MRYRSTNTITTRRQANQFTPFFLSRQSDNNSKSHPIPLVRFHHRKNIRLGESSIPKSKARTLWMIRTNSRAPATDANLPNYLQLKPVAAVAMRQITCRNLARNGLPRQTSTLSFAQSVDWHNFSPPQKTAKIFPRAASGENFESIIRIHNSNKTSNQ